MRKHFLLKSLAYFDPSEIHKMAVQSQCSLSDFRAEARLQIFYYLKNFYLHVIKEGTHIWTLGFVIIQNVQALLNRLKQNLHQKN